MAECPAVMNSKWLDGHTHTCSGHHDSTEGHWCPECKLRFWTTKKIARPKTKKG